MRAYIWLPLAAIFFACPALAARLQFKNWYPEYRPIFQRVLQENCSDELSFYLAGQKNATRLEKQDRWLGGAFTNQVSFVPANCILEHLSEWTKLNMAGAAVLLGLTPSILAALSPSVEEMSSLIVIAKRPLLGVCLAAATPSLFPFRAVNYQEAIRNMRTETSELRPPRFENAYHYHYYVMVFEFAVAMGAMVNNALNSYQLGIQTSCVFAPHIWYLPLMWAFLGILIHLYAAMALWCRVQTERPYKTCFEWLKLQFTPVAIQEPLTMRPLKETIFSVVVSLWVSVNIACHLIFGTITFSSLLFITVRDSLLVIARYMMSLLACRAILVYELSVLREQYRNRHMGHEVVLQEHPH